MKRFAIVIKFFGLLFILLFLRDPENSSYIIEAIGVGVELFAFLNDIPDHDDIADHEGDVLFADDLELVADGIGVDAKGGVEVDEVVLVEVGSADSPGLLVTLIYHPIELFKLLVFHFFLNAYYRN